MSLSHCCRRPAISKHLRRKMFEEQVRAEEEQIAYEQQQQQQQMVLQQQEEQMNAAVHEHVSKTNFLTVCVPIGCCVVVRLDSVLFNG